MSYQDRLKYWALVRLSSSQRWQVVARFHRRADADGHLKFWRQHAPKIEFRVVFDLVETE